MKAGEKWARSSAERRRLGGIPATSRFFPGVYIAVTDSSGLVA
jgi:hypothetical protein